MAMRAKAVLPFLFGFLFWQEYFGFIRILAGRGWFLKISGMEKRDPNEKHVRIVKYSRT